MNPCKQNDGDVSDVVSTYNIIHTIHTNERTNGNPREQKDGEGVGDVVSTNNIIHAIHTKDRKNGNPRKQNDGDVSEVVFHL